MAFPDLSFRVGAWALCSDRLLQFWESRNARKGADLIAVDMLLLDDQSSLIQEFVYGRELIRERAMFELSGFDVTRSNNHFKLCNSVVDICLNEFRKMVEVPAGAN